MCSSARQPWRARLPRLLIVAVRLLRADGAGCRINGAAAEVRTAHVSGPAAIEIAFSQGKSQSDVLVRQTRSNSREICDSQTIWLASCELSFYQIRSSCRRRVGDGRAARLTPTSTGQAQLAHQPAPPCIAHVNAFTAQLLPHLSSAVDAIVFVCTRWISDFKLLSRSARAESGRLSLHRTQRSNRQFCADRLDSERLFVAIDKLDYFGSRGSSSRAKKADAAFRISFERRKS